MSDKNNDYNEQDVLREVTEYINSTYSEHYTNVHNKIQVLDVYKSRGTMTSTCIDNALKYLLRYGKKEGFNRKDLIKATHYLILALGNEEVQ